MSSNNTRDLENLIFDQKLAPQEWFATATKLEDSARVLRKHTLRLNDDIEIRFQEYMLWGFCLENLFKGILASIKEGNGEASSKENKKGINVYDSPTHKLSELARFINFDISIEEKLALDFFTHSTEYLGRYPSPMNSGKQAIYYQSNFDKLLESMMKRLKTIIENIA